jgi:hypothetical protein
MFNTSQVRPIGKLLTFFIVCLFLASCGESVRNEKETAALVVKDGKESEQELIQKEPAAKKTDLDTVEFLDQSSYKFSVSLPISWNMEEMNEASLDYCNYEVTLPDGFKAIELHALTNSRFNWNNIQDLYNASLKAVEMDITYKTQKDNWFVISGIDKKTKHIVCWKRVLGEIYVSDLSIEYPKSREAEIAPFIGRISNSFTSE